jgi:hypothetical protein
MAGEEVTKSLEENTLTAKIEGLWCFSLSNMLR